MSTIPHIIKKRDGCSSDNWCVHYAGFFVGGKSVTQCEAGVEYASVKKEIEYTSGPDERPTYTNKVAHPCFREENPLTGGCAKCRFPTPEEIAAKAAQHKKDFEELRAKSPNRPEPYNIWFDDTAPGVEFTHEDFMKRLKEVHGIDPKTTKGTRSMQAHMDGDTWFSYVWNWEIGGKKFTQSTRQNRTGRNLEAWARD